MTTAHHARRGFSLFEVIAVVIVLVVGAAVVVPRLTRPDAREAQREAVAARDLLSAAALRATLTSQPMSLQWTPPRLSLQTPLPEDGEQSAWTARLVWRDDPLIGAVELGRLEVVKAVASGIPQPDSWRLELSGPEGVPSLEITLRDTSGRTWVVALESGATVAEIIDGDSKVGTPRMVDLDALGMRDAAW